ncbi:hypothetical protein ABZ461_31230 [Actinacidiphila glaucinigra]|uniref:hypothetical protein n=1 Tax=Actinacidiphila glaucinigra TaxID=235986 RepID=UPI0033E21427
MTEFRSGGVRLRQLSVVEEGEEVLVGDPVAGTFVSMPAVGGVVIAALQRGLTLEETATEAEAFAGQPVNIPSFVETLRDLGFVDDGSTAEPVRTAPIQNARWLRGVSSAVVRPLFGRVAWTAYAACALFAVAMFALHPALVPRPADDAFVFSDIGASALLLVPFAMAAVALHEAGHWLGARACGIEARFGVDRRMVLLVFETDLTQVWTLPRKQRYGPLLAGLAADAVVLAGLLGARLLIRTACWTPPGVVDSLLAAWVFIKVTQILWQCMVFLRTDLYAVLVNTLGCRDLWRVKSLMLRRAFGRLSAGEVAELAAAAPADVRAGRWFRWVWLSGFVGVSAWFALLVVPVAWRVVTWAAHGLATGPLTGEFWYSLLCAGLVLGPESLAAGLATRDMLRRVRSAAVADSHK